MRWARPSTMAVLPTPGSPISTGLFLVRRESTWMTRRTSSSRPITGSSLPWRASSVRSRPYFSSAWYLSSGFGSVTRWLPRTLVSASSTRSRVMPRCFNAAADADRPVSRDEPEQQVLGADVVVLHRLGVGRGGVDDHAQARREVRLGAAATPSAAGRARRAGRARARPGSTDSLRRTDGTTPSACSTSVTSRCSGSTDACPSSRARSGRRQDGLLGLLGELLQIHDASPSAFSPSRRPCASSSYRRRVSSFRERGSATSTTT